MYNRQHWDGFVFSAFPSMTVSLCVFQTFQRRLKSRAGTSEMTSAELARWESTWMAATHTYFCETVQKYKTKWKIVTFHSCCFHFFVFECALKHQHQQSVIQRWALHKTDGCPGWKDRSGQTDRDVDERGGRQKEWLSLWEKLSTHSHVLMQTAKLKHRHYILVCGCHGRFGACHPRNAAECLPRSHCCLLLFCFFVFLHTYTNRFLPPWNTRHIVVPVGGNLSRRWHRVTNTHWHLQADDKGDQRLAWERTCHCSLTVDIKDSMVLMNHVTVFSRGNRGGCFGEVMISHTPQGFLLNQWELPTQKPTALLKWFKQFQTAFPNVGRRKAAGLCIPNDPNSNLTCHKAAK